MIILVITFTYFTYLASSRETSIQELTFIEYY